jgi:DnaK suppressor protein
VKSLNVEQIEELRASLLKWRQSIVMAIRLHLHQSEKPDERALLNRFGDDDGPSAELLSQFGIAQLRHEGDELRDIDAALQRIGDGSYGECDQCGAAIPFERMRVQPVAKLCLACQQNVEQRHSAWR